MWRGRLLWRPAEKNTVVRVPTGSATVYLSTVDRFAFLTSPCGWGWFVLLVNTTHDSPAVLDSPVVGGS